MLFKIKINYITYHSRYIREGEAETTQIFLQDIFHKNYLVMRSTADVTGGKLIAVCSQSTSAVRAVNPSRLLRHPWKKARGAILLFCPGHRTRHQPSNYKVVLNCVVYDELKQYLLLNRISKDLLRRNCRSNLFLAYQKQLYLRTMRSSGSRDKLIRSPGNNSPPGKLLALNRCARTST
jgi:hypothetical protein